MTRHPLRTALALAAVLVGIAAAPPPAAAQSGPAAWTAPRPTASPAPASANETAAPRRRPIPRSLARQAQGLRPRSASADSVVTLVSSRAESAAAARFAAIERTLRTESTGWLGIPYRWGGTTRNGIDCSAFVQQFVRQNLGIELPRTTAGQQYEGVSIERDALLPGDLVFFRRAGIRHVGVYLSGGEFVHASTSRGVTVSNLSSSYWDRHYWMSRRILTEPSGRRPVQRLLARQDSLSARG